MRLMLLLVVRTRLRGCCRGSPILKSQLKLPDDGMRLADHLFEASMPSFQVIGDALLVPDDATMNARIGWINERRLPAKNLTKESFDCRLERILSNVHGHQI